MSCNYMVDRHLDVVVTVAEMAKVCAKNDFSFPKNGFVVSPDPLKQ